MIIDDIFNFNSVFSGSAT